MGYLSKKAIAILRESKFISPRCACYYAGKGFSLPLIYKLMANSKTTGFPIIQPSHYLRKRLIPANLFIKWIEAFWKGTLPSSQKNAITALKRELCIAKRKKGGK